MITDDITITAVPSEVASVTYHAVGRDSRSGLVMADGWLSPNGKTVYINGSATIHSIPDLRRYLNAMVDRIEAHLGV